MNLLQSVIATLNRSLGLPDVQKREPASFHTLPYTSSGQGAPKQNNANEYIHYPSVHQTVYACIDVISSKASEVPVVAFRGKETVSEHEILDLINNPNHVHTKVDLIRQLYQHLLTDGNAYLEIVYDNPPVETSLYARILGLPHYQIHALFHANRLTVNEAYEKICSAFARGAIPDETMLALLHAHTRVKTAIAKPTALWPIMPTKVKIIPDKQRFIAGYMFEASGQRIPAGVEDVLHIKLPHPFNDYYGLSPLSAARLAVQTDIQAQQYQANFFENSAQPGGVLSPSFPIEPEAQKELKRQWLEAHRGASSAHRLAILPYGLTYQPVSISQADAQFIETMKLSRDQIREIYRVDDIMLGRGNIMTQSSAIEARATFYQDVIMPLLLLLEQKINKVIAPKFGDPASIKFDPWRMPAMLPVLKLREEVARLRIANAWPVNSVFEDLHGIASPITGKEGNIAHIPGNLLPLGVVSQSVAGPDPKTFSLRDHIQNALRLAEEEDKKTETQPETAEAQEIQALQTAKEIADARK